MKYLMIALMMASGAANALPICEIKEGINSDLGESPWSTLTFMASMGVNIPPRMMLVGKGYNNTFMVDYEETSKGVYEGEGLKVDTNEQRMIVLQKAYRIVCRERTLG